MKRNISIAIIAVFAVLILGIQVLHIALPDEPLSYSERRKLAQLPEASLESIFSGKYTAKAEDYLLDQFPFRDAWRTVKAYLRFNLFRQSDNNGIYLSDDYVFKLDSELDEAQITLGINKLNSIRDTYLNGMRVYYAVIPDKNYFVRGNGYPSLDYEKLLSMISEELDGFEYIDLFPCLELDDYYRTDSHWKQAELQNVVDALAAKMSFEAADLSAYTSRTLSPFYGVFCGQSALPVAPDEITYLTSSSTDSAVVVSTDREQPDTVYDEAQFVGMDGYNIFLGGPSALLTISNESAASDRELIIFCDSFSSSLAPLLTDEYAKITLVDLRYFPANMLADYVEFGGQDVLFLYSTGLWNSAALLK